MRRGARRGILADEVLRRPQSRLRRRAAGQVSNRDALVHRFRQICPVCSRARLERGRRVSHTVGDDARLPTEHVRKDARLSMGYGPRPQSTAARAKPPVVTGGSCLTITESNGDRQVAGLIDVMSIWSPALV